MKIYTGTGDRGKTSLFSGERVSKASERIEAYGDLDELNSIIGALAATLPPEHTDLVNELEHIQSILFDISALLATTPDSPAMDQLKNFSREQFDILEKAIDARQKELPELKGFILPGGHLTAAWSHLAPAGRSSDSSLEPFSPNGVSANRTAVGLPSGKIFPG
jgi:cob(I)alamin adenosyltransferase